MHRIDKVQTLLKENHLAALAVNPGPTLTWLTGRHFHLMERPVILLVTQNGEAAFVLPALESAQLENLPFSVRAFPYGEDPSQWQAAFSQALRALQIDKARIGVETLHLRLLEYHFLQKAAPQAQFIPADETIGRLRLHKTEDEIAAISRAVAVAEKAWQAARQQFRLGMTEKELAAELTLQLLRHGSESTLPFPPIVSAGPNAANPHASPSARPIQVGDLLVVDWGARVEGYISDITRTFAIGAVDAEAQRIHEIVQQANAAGRAAARPGVPCAAVDQAARQLIGAQGYGDFFIHRTGHGFGLETHEPPWIRADNQQLLAVGMVFTVEPGIYLPGANGVRIEDDLVITPEGARCLTTLPRHLERIV